MSKASKLPGRKTRCVERHTCFKVILELYEALVTILDAILSPDESPNMASSDGSWIWDGEAMKAALSSFQTIAVFVITKNVLDEVKSLSKAPDEVQPQCKVPEV